MQTDTIKKEPITVMRVMQDLKPLLEQIYEMQSKGVLQMPSGVSYPIARNYAKCISVKNAFDHFNRKQLTLHVKTEGEGKEEIFMRREDKKNWLFMDDTHAKQYNDAIEEYGQKPADWQPYKIYERDLQQVHNLPVIAVAVFTDFEMITEVEVVNSMKISKR